MGHFIQIKNIRLKVRIYYTSNKRVDFPTALLRLSGWSVASADPAGNGFFRIIDVQSFGSI